MTTTTKTKTENQFSVEQIYAIHTLRVAVKSLAREARYIRKEIHRAGKRGTNSVVSGLQSHLDAVLSPQARLAQLALAFVRGRKYRTVEKSTRRPVHPASLANRIGRAWRMANKDAVKAWLDQE